MRLEYRDIRTALDNLSAVTKGISGNLYVMLRFTGEDKLSFCYSDGKISYIETINAVKQEDDAVVSESETPSAKEETSVVVELNSLESKFKLYSSSGVLVDAINMVVNTEKNILDMDSRKYFMQKITEIDGEVCEPYEEKVYGSRIKTSVVCSSVGSSSKFNTTTRMDYSTIFKLAETEIKDIEHPMAEHSVAYWKKIDKSRFINDMAKLTSTDGATVALLLPDKKKAVAIGRGYSAVIYIGDNGVKGSIGIKNLLTLTSILSKIGKNEEVKCASEGKYLKFITENERVGIQIEMTKTNAQAVASLVKFESVKDYDKEYLVFHKAILQDMIKGALTVKAKEAVTDLMLVLRENRVAIRTFNRSTGSSEESLEVYSIRSKAKNDDLINYNEKHMRISLTNLDNILKCCSGERVIFAFGHDADSKETNDNIIANYLRISDLVDDKVRGQFYLCV